MEKPTADERPWKSSILERKSEKKILKNHFDLVDKIHEFAPFVLEVQGGVGETALKVVRKILRKKKELNLKSSLTNVKEKDVNGGEVLKKNNFRVSASNGKNIAGQKRKRRPLPLKTRRNPYADNTSNP